MIYYPKCKLDTANDLILLYSPASIHDHLVLIVYVHKENLPRYNIGWFHDKRLCTGFRYKYKTTKSKDICIQQTRVSDCTRNFVSMNSVQCSVIAMYQNF